jgi:hypothetical protein
MKTIEINRLEIVLSNLKVVIFSIVEEYISMFNNLRENIITKNVKSNIDLEYINIVLNNLSLAFQKFSIIFIAFFFLF